MIKLSREIRFSLSPHLTTARESANTWAGWPASNWIAPHLVLRCVLSGEPDPITGYLCNITVVDELLRDIAANEIRSEYRSALQPLPVDTLLRTAFEAAQAKWKTLPDASGDIVELELMISPFTTWSVFSKAPSMIEVTRQYEFSAAHRLHCPQYSDEKNRELFGKCNNPNGHGHNYLVDVSVGSEGESIDLGKLDEMVKQHVIVPLDHKHLNEDVEYFRQVNPSVENIVRAIYQWLEPQLRPMILKKVRVYETPKTWAECGES